MPSSWMDLRYSDFYEAIYRKRKSEKEIYVIFTPGLFVFRSVCYDPIDMLHYCN